MRITRGQCEHNIGTGWRRDGYTVGSKLGLACLDIGTRTGPYEDRAEIVQGRLARLNAPIGIVAGYHRHWMRTTQGCSKDSFKPQQQGKVT